MVKVEVVGVMVVMIMVLVVMVVEVLVVFGGGDGCCMGCSSAKLS